MQIHCPGCQQAIEYAEKRPAFCSHCGQSLSVSSIHEAPTQQFVAGTEASQGGFEISGGRPTRVGEYHILHELGQGGMGVVYEAEHERTGRRVALKLLAPGLAQSPESWERFLREGRLAAALSHPRSTFVYEAGEFQGQPFITMELMPGRTLHHISNDEGPLPVTRAVDYMLDVIAGLEAAHAAGVIHRDVKPSNCFIDSDGRVKIGDYGLSKSLVADAALTRTGAFMGTPLFAAPEQVRAGKIDERTDIYAVGATLFFLIARRGPFTGDPAAVIAQIASDPAPSLRSLCAEVPPDLDRIVTRTLHKKPEQRYPNLTELRQALVPFSTGGLSPAPIGRRLGAFFVDATVAGFGCSLVMGILIAGLVAFGVAGQFGQSSDSPTSMASFQLSKLIMVQSQLVMTVLMVSYFAICEAKLGKTVGKHMLGLRVVGKDSGRPGIGRCYLRAALVPGLMWLSMAVLLPWLLRSTGKSAGGYDPQQFLLQQIAGQLPFVPVLLCFITMRASNGYLGVHDLLSGTRVVRMRVGGDCGAASDVPMVLAVASRTEPRRFGPFEVIGLLGRGGGGEIMLAVDESLNRRVWIYVKPCLAPPIGQARAAVSRPARARWLQCGESGSSRWYAFEAVAGAPLSSASRNGSLGWDRGRFILKELADELAAALADGSLPHALSIEQLWVDRDGNLRLLDEAIQSPGSGDIVIARRQGEGVAGVDVSTGSGRPTEPPPSLASGAARAGDAVALLRAATRALVDPAQVPIQVRQFAAELEQRPTDASTLRWAVDQMRVLVDRPGGIRWSDRLVALGVSTGAEYPVLQSVASLFALAAYRVSGENDSLRILLMLSFALLLPVVIGAATFGGPVFRLMEICVRRRDGRPASRLRCAWRNLLAWALVMIGFTINSAILPLFIKSQSGTERVSFGANADQTAQQMLSLLVLAMMGFSFLIQAACMVYAVIYPRRGLQDLLAGTCLTPR